MYANKTSYQIPIEKTPNQYEITLTLYFNAQRVDSSYKSYILGLIDLPTYWLSSLLEV